MFVYVYMYVLLGMGKTDSETVMCPMSPPIGWISTTEHKGFYGNLLNLDVPMSERGCNIHFPNCRYPWEVVTPKAGAPDNQSGQMVMMRGGSQKPQCL